MVAEKEWNMGKKDNKKSEHNHTVATFGSLSHTLMCFITTLNYLPVKQHLVQIRVTKQEHFKTFKTFQCFLLIRPVGVWNKIKRNISVCLSHPKCILSDAFCTCVQISYRNMSNPAVSVINPIIDFKYWLKTYKYIWIKSVLVAMHTPSSHILTFRTMNSLL